MFFLKVYKSEVSNASRTLAQDIQISDILSKSPSAEISKQLVDLKLSTANFWDYGIRAAMHIKKGDVVFIVCKSTVYVTEIIEKIEDESGELGVLLAWDPIFGRPWKNPYALYVRSSGPISREIQKVIDEAEDPLAKNFYPLKASSVGDIFVN